MGSGYTKLLTYLDTGPEAKEDQLKKKYVKIITSGKAPDKCELTWKVVQLSQTDVKNTAKNLRAGVEFIHSARVAKQNLLICIQQEDPDAVVLATAYFMILSGLPPKEVDRAITNALKETDSNLEKKYNKALEELHGMGSPRELRDQLFKSAGNYPLNLLSEDVNKIYELAGLPKPTPGQIKLEEVYVPKTPSDRQSRVSIDHSPLPSPKSPTSPNHDKRKSRGSIPDSPPHSKRGSFDRKHSQDSMDSDHSHHGPELVEASGKHIDVSLRPAALKLIKSCQQTPAKFTGDAGECVNCAVEYVAELNSVITQDESHKIDASNEISAPKSVDLTASAKPIDPEPLPTVDMKVTMRNLLASSKAPDSPPAPQSHISETSWDTLAKLRDSLNQPPTPKDDEKKPVVVNGTIPTERPESSMSEYKTKIKIVRSKVSSSEQHMKAMDEFIAQFKKQQSLNEAPRRPIKIIRAYEKVSTR